MSRYIDAEALQNRIYASPLFSNFGEDGWFIKDFILDLIDRQTTADVVEVVRCKDCAYYREETSYCLNPHCSSSFYGHRVKGEHYCSYGERRENEQS